MNENPDIIENTLRNQPELLEILLVDQTRQKRENELARKRANKTPRVCNILWATDSYPEHRPTDEILLPEITGENTFVIQPRIAKSKEEQKKRVKDKAEVFTPREIVEEMNKQIDWATEHWPATAENWQDYVRELRLEITCGEAPFIVGRYNAATGKKVLKLAERVGFLDRKMQEVGKFCQTKADFVEWSKVAFKSSYGYEWQGDNLLLARENLLYTFIDYWNEQFPEDKINLERKVAGRKLELLEEIAEIISWNIFQMDGLKFVVPMSCKYRVEKEEVPPLLLLLGEKVKTRKVGCNGCRNGDAFSHNGIYVRVMDWEKGKTVRFVDLMK